MPCAEAFHVLQLHRGSGARPADAHGGLDRGQDLEVCWKAPEFPPRFQMPVFSWSDFERPQLSKLSTSWESLNDLDAFSVDAPQFHLLSFLVLFQYSFHTLPG